jgi:putative Mg2+ transporter-C (MgtC) family protein
MRDLIHTFMMTDFAKLLLASLCAALIGWERQRREKAAGLKTHVLIAFGSCLFTIVGMNLVGESDPGALLRIMQGIITGVGFVGAGAIMRQGESVKGITTAAGIWVIAAIGMTVGAGEYLLALYSSVMVVIMLKSFSVLESQLRQKNIPQTK